MVKFTVKNQNLTQFLEKSAAKGIVTITPTEKETRMFFSHFYIDVKKIMEKDEEEKDVEVGKLIVKAVDSGAKKMYIRHSLSGIDIEEEGRIGISDIKQILDVLKAIPKNRTISFLYDADSRFLFVETIDKGTYYGYRLRQAELSETDEIALQNSTLNVDGWDNAHEFEDGFPKITVGEKSAFYDTLIKFKKGELTKVIRDSVDLTLDQDIRLTIEGDKVIFRNGRESDGITSETILKKKIVNPIEAKDFIINNFHPIADHLFAQFNFYCRIAGDGALKYWIKSREGDIELNFCSSSV